MVRTRACCSCLASLRSRVEYLILGARNTSESACCGGLLTLITGKTAIRWEVTEFTSLTLGAGSGKVIRVVSGLAWFDRVGSTVSRPTSSYGQRQVDAERREVTSSALCLRVTPQGAVILLRTLGASPYAIGCLSGVSSCWALSPILHEWEYALVAGWAVVVSSIWTSIEVVVTSCHHFDDLCV